MAGGRPSKYDQRYTPQLAYWMARDGLTDKEMAEKLEIAESTLHEWKNRYPEFSEALKKGKELIDHQVEDTLLKRARGYDYDEVKREHSETPDGTTQKIVKITKHIPPDVTAIIFWLKNRRPEKWRDKQEIDHTSKGEKLDKVEINIIRPRGSEKKREKA